MPNHRHQNRGRTRFKPALTRDVVGLYLNPPDRALVLCVEEKSQIQALDRTAPILPLRTGLPERQIHNYKRHGTTTLFAAFNILNGRVIGTCQERHRNREFIRFLNHLERQLPGGYRGFYAVIHPFAARLCVAWSNATSGEPTTRRFTMQSG
jgi:hypothetical protein